MTVGGDDLAHVLGGAFLRDVVTRLEFSFRGEYGNPVENRRLTLVLDEDEEVEMNIQGEEGWVDRVKGHLDVYLKGKTNKNRKYRWIAGISATLLLTAPFSLVAWRYSESQGTGTTAEVGFVSLFLLAFGYVSSYAVSKLFPSSRLNISSARIPWYRQWAEQITIALIAGMLLALIITALSVVRAG